MNGLQDVRGLARPCGVTARELGCRQGHRIDCYADQRRRAKLLALLPLASGAGIFLLLDNADSKVSSRHLAAIGLFGFTVTFGLFIYELRGIQQCHNLRDQAKLLENMLRFPEGTAPFRDRTDSRLAGVVGAEGAGWIVYTAVIASWLYVAGSGTSIWDAGRGFTLAVIWLIVLVFAWSRSRRGRDWISAKRTPAARQDTGETGARTG